MLFRQQHEPSQVRVIDRGPYLVDHHVPIGNTAISAQKNAIVLVDNIGVLEHAPGERSCGKAATPIEGSPACANSNIGNTTHAHAATSPRARRSVSRRAKFGCAGRRCQAVRPAIGSHCATISRDAEVIADSAQRMKPEFRSASIWKQEAESVQERSLFWKRSAKPGPSRQPRDQ